MPIHESDLTSETQPDAAVRGNAPATALMNQAVDHIVASARPAAPIAVLDAVSENDAARPTATSTRSVLSLLKRYWLAFLARVERSTPQPSLHHMSERELRDIGMRPGEIESITAHRHLDKLKNSSANMFGGTIF